MILYETWTNFSQHRSSLHDFKHAFEKYYKYEQITFNAIFFPLIF